MMRMALREVLKPLRELPAKLERAEAVDEVSARLSSATKGLLGPGKAANDILSGADAGHPLHPVLTDITIGTWTAAVALDLLGGKASAKAADRLIFLGIASATPTALSGLSDWETLYGPAQRLGTVHGASNAAATVAFSMSWLARKRGRRARGVLLGLMGLSLASLGGFLGGHLSYRRGAGVDHTAFSEAPGDWVDVGAEADFRDDEPVAAQAASMRIMVVRHQGRLHALADVCAHQGGPLHEGRISDGCVSCPWHQSVFRLSDGEVQGGPSAHPQPVLALRVRDGRVEVKAAA